MESTSFFNWSAKTFRQSEYDERIHWLKEEMVRENAGIFLIPSKHHFSDGSTYRQLDDFNYFTGLEIPDSVLAFDAERDDIILFIPARDPRFEQPSRPNDFPGRDLINDPDFRAKCGLADVRPIAEFDVYLSGCVGADRSLFMRSERRGLSKVESSYFQTYEPLANFVRKIRMQAPEANIVDAYPAIARLRMIKSDAEIETMRRAAHITMAGIRHSLRLVRPGVDERTLEGAFEDYCKRKGSQRLAFDSIIKSGPNSLWAWRILASHYNRRNRQMQAGELVLYDVGCELDHYGSDMGRTFPVSGAFSARQYEILNMQNRVLDAIIEEMKPGVTLAEANRAGMAEMPASAMPHMQVGPFFGHHIGLSMGDPNLLDMPLAPGMIITVEPWYYNHDEGLATFLEDIILIIESGYENLTAGFPRDPQGMAEMVIYNAICP